MKGPIVFRSMSLESELVERDASGVPTAFRIWKGGENPSDGGTDFFTKASADALMAEQAARGRKYSIDFDHLSLTHNRPAEAGRAAGWNELEVRGEDLWAVNVEWCADVRAGLEEKPPRWRFFSPAFQRKGREITSYINMALCINPLTHGLPSLASIQPNKEKETEPMDPKEALQALLSGAECSDEMKAAIKKAYLEDEVSEEEKKAEEPAKEEPKKEEVVEEKKAEVVAHAVAADSANAAELVRQGKKLDELTTQVRAMLTKLQAPVAQRMSAPTQGEKKDTAKSAAEADESFDIIQRAFGLKKDELKAPGLDEAGRWVVPSIDPTYLRGLATKKGA